jgi:hypothetical protein
VTANETRPQVFVVPLVMLYDASSRKASACDTHTACASSLARVCTKCGGVAKGGDFQVNKGQNSKAVSALLPYVSV